MNQSEQKPAFSVVVPAYNAGRWIGEAIASALDQEPAPREIVVVDDGSTDNTVEALGTRAHQIRLFRQDNAGVAAARNRGIEAAGGDWIAFLDADDRWRPGHLDRIARAIESAPAAGLIYTDAMVIDEQGREIKPKRSRPPGPDPFRSLLLQNTITTSAAAVRREGFERAGLFYSRLKGPEDWDLWLRLSRLYPMVHVPEISVDYRRRTGGLVHTRGTAMRDDNLLVVSRAAALDPGLPEVLLRRARANCFLESAVRLLAALEPRAAREELWQALRESPALARAWALWAVALAGRPGARAALALGRWRERRR